MGDFIGFEFGGVRSDELGIVRVSGGDRFEEQLHPEIKDITAEVPGMDGEYYFGSTYGTKTIDLEFAFDSLTEVQFRKLRQVFGTKEIKKLIFDERPYKYYMAKIESPIELSYVCFDELKYTWKKVPISSSIEDEGDYLLGVSKDENGKRLQFEYKEYDQNGATERIYKGEGKISFVCYFPFAKSVFKELPSEYEEADWVVSSGILSQSDFEEKEFDTYDNTSGIINIYNPGDLTTGFRLYCPFNNGIIEPMSINYCKKEEIDGVEVETVLATLNLNQIQCQDNDNGILIDTNMGLIQGATIDNDNIKTVKHIYNQYIQSGYLFKLEPNIIDDIYIKIIQDSLSSGIEIFYDYLYF